MSTDGEDVEGVVIAVDASEPFSIDKVEAEDVDGVRENGGFVSTGSEIDDAAASCSTQQFTVDWASKSRTSGGRKVVDVADDAAELSVIF